MTLRSFCLRLAFAPPAPHFHDSINLCAFFASLLHCTSHHSCLHVVSFSCLSLSLFLLPTPIFSHYSPSSFFALRQASSSFGIAPQSDGLPVHFIMFLGNLLHCEILTLLHPRRALFQFLYLVFSFHSRIYFRLSLTFSPPYSFLTFLSLFNRFDGRPIFLIPGLAAISFRQGQKRASASCLGGTFWTN